MYSPFLSNTETGMVTRFVSTLRVSLSESSFDDFEGARAELEGKGVSFLGETVDSGVCYMAPFSDPDGNVLLIHHRYAPRS